MSFPTIQEIWSRFDEFLPGAWERAKATRDCNAFVEEHFAWLGDAGSHGDDLRWDAAEFGLWRSLGEGDFDLAERFLAEFGERADEFFNPTEFMDGGPVTEAMLKLGNRPDIIEWLLRHGASTEQRSFGQLTPLHHAAGSNYVRVVKLLLEHGADIEAGTVIDGDKSPLMEAAYTGAEESCRLLCERGADKMRRNKMLGGTAQEIASNAGKHKAAAIIESTSRIPPRSNRSRKRRHE